MLFQYIDIGTADFETSLDVRKQDEKVLLVEPLFYYLKNLPEGEGIYKANFAVSDKRGFERVYYIKEADIQQYNLPGWVRGCNSLGKEHVTVVNLLHERKLPNSLISRQEVRVITFQDIIKLYDITTIGQLKIDTEGHDHFILPDVIKLIQRGGLSIEKIICEYLDAFNNKRVLDILIAKLVSLGYTPSQYGDNMTLTKQS